MIREVIHDPLFLSGKSEKAIREDLPVAQDLLDTLIANRAGCVGMAANMIGVRKRIIAFDDNGKYTVSMILKKAVCHYLVTLVHASVIRA